MFSVLLLSLVMPPAKLYPVIPLAKVASGTWVRPRAKISGIVTEVRHEEDGDWHIRLEGADGAFVILEIIPELPLKGPPKKGDKIIAWGVVRYDGEHKWSELHPLIGWVKP